MEWSVTFTKKAIKGVNKMPRRERDVLNVLVKDIMMRGPVLPDWKNYSRLGSAEHHCHLSYKWVACWRVEDKEVKLIEIYYAGSREDAPY